MVTHFYRGDAAVGQSGGLFDWVYAEPGAIECRWASGMRNTRRRVGQKPSEWAQVRASRQWVHVSCRACFRRAHRRAVEQARGPRV